VMLCMDGESAVAGAERWAGTSPDEPERMDWNVRALRSGVEPRTEERGWIGSPKSVVGCMEPVLISPFSSHQVCSSA
jgi:hypothetical protein